MRLAAVRQNGRAPFLLLLAPSVLASVFVYDTLFKVQEEQATDGGGKKKRLHSTPSFLFNTVTVTLSLL